MKILIFISLFFNQPMKIQPTDWKCVNKYYKAGIDSADVGMILKTASRYLTSVKEGKVKVQMDPGYIPNIPLPDNWFVDYYCYLRFGVWLLEKNESQKGLILSYRIPDYLYYYTMNVTKINSKSNKYWVVDNLSLITMH